MELDNKLIPSIEDIKYICNNIFGMLKIPIIFMDNEGKVIFEFSDEYLQNVLYPDYLELYGELMEKVQETTCIFTSSAKYFENYAFIVVRNEESFIGTIIIGPCLFSEIDKKSVDQLIKALNIQIKHREKLIYYYQHMVTTNYDTLINACSILYNFIYHERLSLVALTKDFDIYAKAKSNSHIKYSLSQTEKIQDFEHFMQDNINNGFFHHSLKFEKELLACVEQGDKNRLIEFLQTNSPKAYGKLSKNPLRNQKDHFIAFISIVSRKAVEGGLDWELALTLSDYYIQTVEEESSVNNIFNLFHKMLIDFTERVGLAKENYSTAIIKCKNYIFQHLFDKIQLSDMAEISGMNSSYISHLFKKEVGLTIRDYIQKEKIEIAKKLILSSNKTLSEIYTSLGFIDQSHFTKVFKKFAEVTPKEYKLKNKY